MAKSHGTDTSMGIKQPLRAWALAKFDVLLVVPLGKGLPRPHSRSPDPLVTTVRPELLICANSPAYMRRHGVARDPLPIPLLFTFHQAIMVAYQNSQPENQKEFLPTCCHYYGGSFIWRCSKYITGNGTQGLAFVKHSSTHQTTSLAFNCYNYSG